MSVTDPNFNPSGNFKVDELKHAFRELEDIILSHCPEGRRKALALTHLETAAMFAVKSVFEP